jgi:phosphatidate cytidylyltransferase
MNEVYKRSITGIVIVTVVVCSVVFGRYTFFILCSVIGLLGLVEFYRLLEIRKKVLRVAGLILSASLLITVFIFTQYQADWRVLLVNLPLVSIIFMTVLFGDSDNPFQELALIFLGQIYITFSLILLYHCAFALNKHFFNAHVILGYFFFLWVNDTGAYVCGSLFGNYKLAPDISPNKTWEGSVGGAFLVMVLVYVNYHFFKDLSLTNWMILGIIVIVTGTLGDLVKSVLKRSRNVKDSGNILPGHGGILDRFDSLIGSVLFVYTYLSMLNE